MQRATRARVEYKAEVRGQSVWRVREVLPPFMQNLLVFSERCHAANHYAVTVSILFFRHTNVWGKWRDARVENG